MEEREQLTSNVRFWLTHSFCFPIEWVPNVPQSWPLADRSMQHV